MSDDTEQPSSKSYDVGYGKPPKEGQFKPGHQRSKGKRKRRTLETELLKALGRKLTIRQNGETSQAHVTEALAKKLIAEALSGKRWAFEMLAHEIRRLDAVQGGGLVAALLDEDRAILEQLAAKLADSGNER